MKKTKVDVVRYSWEETSFNEFRQEDITHTEEFFVAVEKHGNDVLFVSLKNYFFGSDSFGFEISHIDNILEALEAVKAKYQKYAKKKD